MIRRLLRLAYLIAQHPVHLHRALVRRGLVLGWIDDFIPFWDTVRPPSLPIADYTSYLWLAYHFTQRARAKYPVGDHFEDLDWQYARLLSYVKRRELHPLRMLVPAWWLRKCQMVLEFGAGAAPYDHFIQTAWPWKQTVVGFDIPSLLAEYTGAVIDETSLWQHPWDGIVATEVFEHLPDPLKTAQQMTQAARVIVFDYTKDTAPGPRLDVFTHFYHTGTLRGWRDFHVWTKGDWTP